MWRFLRYSGVGVSTFAIDLLLLFILTDVAGVQYLLAAAASFAIAVSLNYVLSRRLVFSGTRRPFRQGYAIFLCIALGGMASVTGLLYVFVDVLGLHYILSRVCIAGIVGMWNFVLNLHVTFRMAGRSGRPDGLMEEFS